MSRSVSLHVLLAAIVGLTAGCIEQPVADATSQESSAFADEVPSTLSFNSIATFRDYVYAGPVGIGGSATGNTFEVDANNIVPARITFMVDCEVSEGPNDWYIQGNFEQRGPQSSSLGSVATQGACPLRLDADRLTDDPLTDLSLWLDPGPDAGGPVSATFELTIELLPAKA